MAKEPIRVSPPIHSETAPPRVPKKSLAAIVGLVAALGLFNTVPVEESGRKVEATVAPSGEITVAHKAGNEHLKAYRDIVGVLTVCDGDTKNVTADTMETRAGCQRRLEQQLIAHAEPVMACIPTLREEGRDDQRWAAISLAYNIGVSGICKSTVAKRFRARDWRGGCDAFLMWDKAGGKRVRGLTLRRQRERAICLKGLL